MGGAFYKHLQRRKGKKKANNQQQRKAQAPHIV